MVLFRLASSIGLGSVQRWDSRKNHKKLTRKSAAFQLFGRSMESTVCSMCPKGLHVIIHSSLMSSYLIFLKTSAHTVEDGLWNESGRILTMQILTTQRHLIYVS
jgi:hypothetical protein